MSQKINPISTRLGILQLWNIKFTIYGKNFKYYIKFLHNKFKVFIFFKSFLQSYNILLENINLRFIPSRVIIDVFIVQTPTSKDLLNTNSLVKVVHNWVKVPLAINFYKKLNLTSSAFLINNYIKYLVLQGYSPKRLVQTIHKLFKEQSTQYKLVQTVQGINKVTLKGFKLKFSGCFDMSRSQMAKVIKCNFGPLPLTKLNGYVEYSNNTLYTKFGSCGLKVWLFYEIKFL